MLERNIPDAGLSSAMNFATPIHQGGSTIQMPYYPTPQQGQTRRYLSPIFKTGLLVVGLCLAVILWEKNAPYEYKVSVRLGEFSGTTAAAALKAQQDARLEFEGKAKQLEEIMQTNIAKNQAEMQAYTVKLQAELQRINAAYSAMYERGNMFAANMAQAQREFMTLRNQMTANAQGGAMAAGNVAGLLGGLVDIFGGAQNQQMAQHFYDKAAEINRRNRNQMDETASTDAPLLRIEQEWHRGMPSPNEFMMMTNDIASKMVRANEQTIPPNFISGSNLFEKRPYEVIKANATNF